MLNAMNVSPHVEEATKEGPQHVARCSNMVRRAKATRIRTQSHKLRSSDNLQICEPSRAPIGAPIGTLPPELVAVMEAWPTLPDNVKADILAIVRARAHAPIGRE